MHINVSKRLRIRSSFDRSPIERERMNQSESLRSEEGSQSDNFMASQHPLHSFSLPKWLGSKNHTNNHIRGRGLGGGGGGGAGESSSPSRDAPARPSPQFSPALPLRHSPLSDSTGQSPMRGFALDSECSWAAVVKSPIMLGKPEDRDLNSDEEKRDDMEKSDHGKKKKTVDQEGDDNESIAKTWNLRPRKPLVKSSNANANTSKAGGSALHEKKVPSLKGTEGNTQAKTAEKKKENDKVQMPKFSISLSNQEIAEDFFVMTGEKLPRRPKRRPKQVQKHLDNIFPGLWLPTLTPDAYKVTETQPKESVVTKVPCKL